MLPTALASGGLRGLLVFDHLKRLLDRGLLVLGFLPFVVFLHLVGALVSFGLGRLHGILLLSRHGFSRCWH